MPTRPSTRARWALLVGAVVALAAPATPARADATTTGPAVEAAVERARGWQRPLPAIETVVLVGDSLAQEITPFVAHLTAPKRLVPKFWGGTAACDWVGVHLAADRSSVVVISFTGNSHTPCMQDEHGVQIRQERLVARYRADVGRLIDTARRAGARVVLVGQPLRAPSFDADLEVEGLNEVYRAYASALPFVSYVDAGAAVEAPDGSFTARLPCIRWDPGCGADGTVVVRGDGVHFCPLRDHNPCPVWSSGAFRFASRVADAANGPQRYD